MNNDFHNTYDLFDLFEGLAVRDLDVEIPADGAAPKPETNGTSHTNGHVPKQNGHASEIDIKN